MKELPKLTPRLRAAADTVSAGAFIADVGTDHAYLPIALCLEGKIRGGVASDINEGPLERARENIDKYGLGDKISTVLADGLEGIREYEPEYVMILGMGGELIARILADASWLKKGGIRLCLQPMTHPEKLREFLSIEGYSIIDERIAIEEKDDRIYQIILAEYSGMSKRYPKEQLLLGEINIRRGGAELEALAAHHIQVLRRRIAGKQTAGADISEETLLISAIESAVLKGERK